MRRLRSLRAVAALLALSLPARAIVYRSDETDATAVSLSNQPQFSGVGYIFNGAGNEIGTATAIAPGWVLTAKHVVTGYTTATFHAANGQAITGTVYADPNSDMALVKLNSNLTVTGASAVAIITPNLPGAARVDPVGEQIWNVGYGNFGTYGGTVNNLDLKRRAGTNVVNALSGQFLTFDNDNTSGTEFESSTGPGDSGGPMFLQNGYQWLVVGEVYGVGTGAQGFIDTDVTVNNFITTTTGLSFAPAAAPTALKWNAAYASASTVGSKNITTLLDGAGTWNSTRLDFTDGVSTFAWQNGTLLPVTFGVGSGTAGTVTLGGAISISNLTFDPTGSGSYTIAGGGTNALTLSATGSTITTNVAAAISAPLTGGALVKAGTATLTFSGANTYSGGTTISRGTLALTGSGTLGSTSAALAMASGTLDLGGTSQAVGNFSGTGAVTNSASATVSRLTIGTGNATGGNYAGTLQDGAGTLALTKTGTGTLTLSGVNSYTGSTTLSGGTLALGSALPSATSLLFSGSSTLDLGARSQSLVSLALGSVTAASTYAVTNGSLTLTGAVDFSLNALGASGTTVLDLSGAAAFTYDHATNAFGVGGPGSTGLGTTLKLAAVNTITAATLAVGGQTTAASTPAGTLDLGTSNTIRTGAIQLGGYRIGTTLLDFQSGLTNPSVTLRGTAGGVTPVTTVIVGQNNNGTAQAGSLNLSSGTTDAIIGNLLVAAAATNGATTGTVRVAGTASVLNASTITLGYSFSTNGSANTTTGTFTQDAGTVLAGAVVFGTRTGSLGTGTQAADSLLTTWNLGTAATPALLSAQTLSIGTLVSGAASRATFNFLNGTLATYDPARGQVGSAGAAGNSATPQDLTISGATGGGAGSNNSTLTINLAAGANVIHTFYASAGRTLTVAATALINGGGALDKDGPGTLTLAGSDQHTGATTVTAGTLNVSGSISGSTAVTVKTTAMLGGTGSITAGGVALEAGAKLSPGLAGAGQFSFTLGSGQLDVSAAIAGSDTHALLFDLGSSSDLVKLNTGTLALGVGGLGLDDFSFTSQSGFGPGSYTLFNTFAPISGSLDLAHTTGLVGGFAATLSFDVTAEKVMLTVIPEPGAGGLLAAGALALAMRRRRRGITLSQAMGRRA